MTYARYEEISQAKERGAPLQLSLAETPAYERADRHVEESLANIQESVGHALRPMTQGIRKLLADAAKPELDELMTTVLKRQAIADLLPQSKEPAVLEQIDYDAVRTAAQEATTKREVDAEEQRDLNRAQTQALQGMATDAKNSAQSQKNYNFSMLFLALVSLAVAVGAFIAAVR